MSFSVDEKVAYNRGKDTGFSAGYIIGVNLYRGYPKMTNKRKAEVKDLFASAAKESRRAIRKGDKIDEDIKQYNKGIMCGVRDAANERKARKGK